MNISVPPKHVTELTKNLNNEIILVCWTFMETLNIASSQSNCWRFSVVVITFRLVSILSKSNFALNYKFFNWISTYTASVEQWRSLLPVGGERWRCRWLDACCRRVQSLDVILTLYAKWWYTVVPATSSSSIAMTGSSSSSYYCNNKQYLSLNVRFIVRCGSNSNAFYL